MNYLCVRSIIAAVDEKADDFDIVLKNAARAALRKGLVSDPNDLLVVTAGIPFGTPGAANIIRILPAGKHFDEITLWCLRYQLLRMISMLQTICFHLHL